MAVPVSAGHMEYGAPPQHLRDKYSKYWWGLVVLYVFVILSRFLSYDFWGGLISACMAIWASYLVSADCQRMTQYCVLLYGAMSLFQLVIDLVNLLSTIPGRIVETGVGAQPVSSSDGVHKASYVITISTLPFFLPSQGFLYNFQSAMMIVQPVVDFCGLVLCYATYQDFPSTLFEDDDEERFRSIINRSGAIGNQGSASRDRDSTLYGSNSSSPSSSRSNVRRDHFHGNGQRLV